MPRVWRRLMTPRVPAEHDGCAEQFRVLGTVRTLVTPQPVRVRGELQGDSAAAG